jgi:hypothetical protein
MIVMPRIRKKGSLKQNLRRKIIRQETLQKAKEICVPLDLPLITVEVVKNITRHPLYKKDEDPYIAFYLDPSVVPFDYAIPRGMGLIVMEEDDRDFLATLFHELGHALEPKDFEEDYSELWAWFFAYIVLRDALVMEDAAYCWREVLKCEENLKFGAPKKRKCLTIFS